MIRGGFVQNAGAGPIMFRYIDVNLDSKPAKIIDSIPNRIPLPSDPPSQSKPIEFPYYVSETSSEIFNIIAHTRGDVTWYAELLWSVDGANGVSVINNGGNNFETAVNSRATASYSFNNGGWRTCPKSAMSC
jgi:hypothetical protein